MVYVHLAEGFEEIEALATADILRRAGVEVSLVSVSKDGTVTGAHQISVVADFTLEDADYDQCEMIVLPGGMPGTTNLMDHDGLTEEILNFAANPRKRLAAICAAPMILGHLGLLEGKEATIYTGMEEHLKGAIHSDEKVVVSGRIITAKGPGATMDFALTLVEILKNKETADQVRKAMIL